MKSSLQCFIDGRWVDPVVPHPFALIDPVSELPYAEVNLAGKVEVDAAVDAARRAFPAFSRVSREVRISLLERIAALMEQRLSDLAAMVTQEIGAPKSTATHHAQAAIGAFRQAASTLKSYEFETKLGHNVIRREPIGVCGLITAWNWPLQLVAIKLSSAIAAGCTSVLKPSEFTPGSACLLLQILVDAGVPKGVVNLVQGDGPTVGAAVSGHDGIDLVSFTGSTRAGILVAEAAASNVKRVCQELGGKSANLILRDADLLAAASWNIARCFSNSGQSCHAPSRILVHHSQRVELLNHLVTEVAKVRVGAPTDDRTTMGPVVNRAQYDRIQGFIKSGIAQGAKLVCGGVDRPEGLDRGFYIKPTIFCDVLPAMKIAQEEIFGPVISVLTYEDEQEAIDIVNGTTYGLGGYIFSSDARRARELACEFKSGRVFLNGAPTNTAAPLGGYKMSGNGREMGVFGLEEYLEVKALIGFPE